MESTIKKLITGFTILGLLLIAISILLFVNTQHFLKTSIAANGKVTALIQGSKSGVAPEVSFIANNGKEYVFSSSFYSSPPSYSIGENIKVLYLPQNPHHAKIDDFTNIWCGPLILFIIGFIFSAVGAFFMRISMLRKWLKENGQIIEAVVQSAGIDAYIKVSGRPTYVIIAQWVQPSSNLSYTFKSDLLCSDPQEYVKPGDKIKVSIDPNNPKRYFLDTSFLPTKIP